MKVGYTALLVASVFLPSLHAQSGAVNRCQAPGVTVTAGVTEYVLKKYHLASAEQLVPVESVKANDDCYWKFRFQVASSHREIVLYLAPDRRYLTTTLYDRTSDPLLEEKQQRNEAIKALSVGRSPSRGPKDAPVTVTEFSDFECPYCQRLTNILEKEVLPSEPGMRIVFKNFPLAMHPWARQAAQLTACAGMQSDEAFWVLHDYVFSNQKEITPSNVEERIGSFADQQPSLDHKAFHDCVDQGLTVGPVMKDEELGRKEGVHATPTVFINGTRIEGIRDAAQLKELISAAKRGELQPTPAAQAVDNSAPRPQGGACTPTPSKGGVNAQQ